jgi:hypothetical protein
VAWVAADEVDVQGGDVGSDVIVGVDNFVREELSADIGRGVEVWEVLRGVFLRVLGEGVEDCCEREYGQDRGREAEYCREKGLHKSPKWRTEGSNRAKCRRGDGLRTCNVSSMHIQLSGEGVARAG